jgi:uncharacterized glyoxalase superfamily protein PhnB
MLANRSMPRCAVIPVLAYDQVGEAVGWLCETFGFTERWRAGNHRAQLAVGEGAAVALTQRPVERTLDAAGVLPLRDKAGHSVMVRVEDVNSHHERALQHGARILEPPADYPYGERQYTAEDTAGHRWTFSQSIADVAPEEWGGTSGAS